MADPGALLPLLARSLGEDTLLLLRLPRDQARRLAATIMREPGHPAALRDAARRFVSLEALLGSLAGTPDDGVAPGRAGPITGAAGGEGHSVGEAAVRMAAELGPAALAGLAAGVRDRLMTEALRHLAATAQGGAPSAAVSDAALQAIEGTLGRLGQLPFALAPDESVGARALADWRDAVACGALPGVTAGPLWAAARRAAAFAALWRAPASVASLPPIERDRLVRDGAEAARLVLAARTLLPVASAARTVAARGGTAAA